MTELLPIDQVRPSTYNPRTADPARLDLVELSLRKLGFLLPLYADADGELLSGHQRHHVAQRMGLPVVPVARVKAMPLAERKAVNIAFNRGTNDLRTSDTTSGITRELATAQVHEAAAALPDREASAMYPCMNPAELPVADLVKINTGRWIPYARSLSRTLAGKGIHMPIVVGPDGMVVNGIGRLELAAQKNRPTIDAVQITAHEVTFATAMLNLLSMDFDIHNRYAELLRYNSFRRARRQRGWLGRGFVFGVLGGQSAKGFDLENPEHRRQWIWTHGTSVLDFGSGHGTEAEMLRQAGIYVTEFEPYRIDRSEQISKTDSLQIVRAFLQDVAQGRRYSSAFIASVLNSVPFAEDRRHVVTLVAALCDPRTTLYACASSDHQADWRNIQGSEYINANDVNHITFALEYEPGVKLGDFSDKPKVQKYHTNREFYELFAERFAAVQVSDSNNNVEAICRHARPVDQQALCAAIEFEFNLPYPDGSYMGMVAEAKAAYSQRLGIVL